MTKKVYFVFDFDSTLTQVEAIEELADISLKGNKNKKKIIREIEKITEQGIDGDISFTESLERRLKMLDADKKDLDKLVKRLKRKISKSIARNKHFFKDYADNIYVVSCGFKEFIDPIVEKYGIPSERVFANTFRFNKRGKIVGFDEENDLAKPDGKIAQLKKMELEGEVHVLGDGYSDYQMREAGLAHKFYAYTENVERSNILGKADHVAPSLDEFLYVNKLPMAISYPKNRIKVLLTEGIHTDGRQFLEEEGYTVETIDYSPDEDELAELIKDVSVIGIRSKTHITPKVLTNANKLLAVGAFCIGTNQIHLEACMKRGVAVFNAPYSNTRSVVELVIGEIIMLMRNIFERSTEMHAGQWRKSAKDSYEIRGKTLGIIGYGNIGAQLSVLAEALGMNVMYHDIKEKLALGNAEKAKNLRQLLRKADVISVHVDGQPENEKLIGEKEFRLMKEGAVFINLSRGFVADLKALKKHLDKGKLKGAAIDVYPREPQSKEEHFVTELTGMPNVILTPHIGGSTEEAQRNIAAYVPNHIINYINTGNSHESVNIPNLQLPQLKNAHRLLHIHDNVPGIMAQVNNIFAKHNINVLGQYLKTNEHIGYMITDIDKEYDEQVIKELRKIEHTIRLRILY